MMGMMDTFQSSQYEFDIGLCQLFGYNIFK